MSNSKDDNDGSGCLFIVGAVIAGLSVGELSQAVYGWLVIGVSLMIIGAISVRGRPVRK